MTFVSDIVVRNEYFVLNASARQRRAIERVGPFRHEASISHTHTKIVSISRPYTEAIVDDHTRKEVSDVAKDDIEAFVPEAPTNLTIFTRYYTHVATLIWQH